jgi:hypothetical protein
MKKFILFLGLLVTAAAHGQPAPVIRAKLVPPNGVIVGQPVRLEVVVLVPNYFTGAPVFPLFELDGAIVTLSDDRPEHLNEQVNGATYAGIRRFYVIYPEQSSDFHLPPVEITVPYAAVPPATAVATLHLPPLHFRADLPAAARDLDYFLPTSRLTIPQKWSGSLSNLRVGDSVARTIVVTTEKMQAMLIPPMQLSAPEGVRIYPKGPSVEDEKSVTGVFTQGVRTERASYLFAKPGDYVLPEIEITWWNLATQKLTASKLPAVNFHVSDASAYVSELPPEQEPPAAPQSPRRNWRQDLSLLVKFAIVLVLAAILFWAIRRWGPRFAQRYRAFASRHRASESAYWHRFKEACYRNDDSQSYALLLAWLRRSDRTMTLDEFQHQAADPHLNQQIAILSQTLFGSPAANWNGPTFHRTIAAHRRHARSTKHPVTHLPALNPEP